MDSDNGNNGWIKPKSSEDYPTDDKVLYKTARLDKVYNSECKLEKLLYYLKAGIVTHYKPIPKEKPPIF